MICGELLLWASCQKGRPRAASIVSEGVEIIKDDIPVRMANNTLKALPNSALLDSMKEDDGGFPLLFGPEEGSSDP